MDWELECELAEARQEAEWEAEYEEITACDKCGMTDHKYNMYPVGFRDRWLCTECELEEDWEVDID